MNIREAAPEDFDNIWPIFHEVVSIGESYPYPRDTTREQAFHFWMEIPHKTYVAEENGKILGTYYIKPNQPGAGSHVSNCGYMVSSLARGGGVATAMCEHSQKTAVQLGYKAMQFNLVVSSNEKAVKLWTKLGFKTLARIPKAFQHPTKDYVDALLMYKWLDSTSD